MNLWIARDASNALFIYEEKPYLEDGTFWPIAGTFFQSIPARLYPCVRLENSPLMLIP